MCLVTQNNFKPFIAQKDLRVIKGLIKHKDGSYVTPFQGFPVKLNDILVPVKNNYGFIISNHNKYRINVCSGYIHAWIKYNVAVSFDPSLNFAEAYIPKGAEYYIDVECGDICADKLYITNETVDGTMCSYIEKPMLYNKLLALTQEEILNIIQPIVDTIQTDKVSLGWVYTSDKRFVHPLNFDGNKMTAIGVVACMNGSNNAIIFSVDEYNHTWHTANGICKSYSKTDDDLGKWGLPLKEVFQDVLINSIMQINSTLLIINKMVIHDKSYYWVSDKGNFVDAWYCNSYYINQTDGYQGFSYNVRPSLVVPID